uniref:Uncharacterized protein TCIL3000_11_13140 n=1 Tax=Trypanosoma congolense (strain IL3000) TaxID=1068625 RepID=G0V2E3_TRYCI|nr:unnamed protein product [Trypanosoma congolense IL3000]
MFTGSTEKGKEEVKETPNLQDCLNHWRTYGWLSGRGGDPPAVRSRSFRPSRIVPRFYLGAAKDVRDPWELRERILPEKLLMIVSTCEPKGPPRLELRRLESVAKGTKRVVRRVAVSQWEELERNVVVCSPGGGCSFEEATDLTTKWLRHALLALSFPEGSGDEERPVADGAADSCDVACGDGTDIFRAGVYAKLCLPWEDEKTFAVRPYFAVATALMHAVMEGLRGAVVCHCMAGRSRSAALTCALLLYCCCNDATWVVGKEQTHARDIVQTVVEFIREARLCVSPNEGFTRQLMDYARDLLSAG